MDQPAVTELLEPRLHRPPPPLVGEDVGVHHDVGDVLHRWAGARVVLVNGPRPTHEEQLSPTSGQPLAEVGVLGAIAGEGLVEPT